MAKFSLWAVAAVLISGCSGDDRGGSALSVTSKALEDRPWVWQNPLPVGNRLDSVSFANAADGWAVGAGGAIIVTRDGGATWTAVSNPDMRMLRGVSAAASGAVWAVGDGGLILKSASGGTFTPQLSGTTKDLYAVDFVSDAKGWVAGDGIILATLDGGATWAPQTIPVEAHLFTSISFINETTGWATGILPGTLHTVDGGITWTALSPMFSGYFRLTFVDSLNGWAVSGGASVFHSSDGGVTWQTQTTPLNQFVASLIGIGFADAQNGWAVGVGADLIHTTDGGQTWIRQTTERLAYTLRDVIALDASHAVAVGENGQILRTSNAGTTWTDPFPGTRIQLRHIAVLDENQAWAMGDSGGGVLLYTGDGGSHWTILQNPGDGLSSIAAYMFPGTSQPTLWGTSGTKVLKSTDRGVTWTSTTLDKWLSAVSFPDPQHGWVAGPDGVVFATVDGGTTWTQQNSGITDAILHIQFANATTGWMLGVFSRNIVATKDGGATWTKQVPSHPGLPISDLAVANERKVWVAGDFRDLVPCVPQANIARTVDGGATWIPLQVGPANTEVRSISFVNPQKGWLLLDGNQIYKTTNGGETWTFQSIPTAGNFLELRFANPNVGWIVGEGGSIMKTEKGGD